MTVQQWKPAVPGGEGVPRIGTWRQTPDDISHNYFIAAPMLIGGSPRGCGEQVSAGVSPSTPVDMSRLRGRPAAARSGHRVVGEVLDEGLADELQARSPTRRYSHGCPALDGLLRVAGWSAQGSYRMA